MDLDLGMLLVLLHLDLAGAVWAGVALVGGIGAAGVLLVSSHRPAAVAD